MSKLNIDMIREIKNNHPAVPEPFLNESKRLDAEEDYRKAFLSSLELQTLNPELKRPPQSFCYVRSELDLPMKG